MSHDPWEFVPLDELTTPNRGGLLHVYVDYGWTVHPEKGALFYRHNPRSPISPQANSNRLVVEHRLKDREVQGCVAMQLPVAFVPHRCDP